MEYFTLLFKTNNKLENKDTNIIWLGKYNTENKEYRIYKLRVNSKVNFKIYHQLLLEGDFSNTDFKENDFEKIKEFISSNKTLLKGCSFEGNCGDLKQYIRENFG